MLEILSKIPLYWVWLAIFIVFIVVEVTTYNLVTIWFAAGALFAAALAFMGVGFYFQLALFFVISIALLVFTRPTLKKYQNKNADKTKTNVDSLIGKSGVLTKGIRKNEFGQVKVAAQTWTACSKNSEVEIEEGKNVIVLEVSGVKLVVEEAE